MHLFDADGVDQGILISLFGSVVAYVYRPADDSILLINFPSGNVAPGNFAQAQQLFFEGAGCTGQAYVTADNSPQLVMSFGPNASLAGQPSAAVSSNVSVASSQSSFSPCTTLS